MLREPYARAFLPTAGSVIVLQRTDYHFFAVAGKIGSRGWHPRKVEDGREIYTARTEEWI
jgi:hypothetical protein